MVAVSSGAAAAPTTVEVYYSTSCPNCLQLIQDGALPLLEAQLPSDQVRATLLPWKGDRPSIAAAHMCALRGEAGAGGVGSAPVPGARFVACDLVNLIVPDAPDRTEETARSCAAQAGLAWDGAEGLQACFDGGAGVDLLMSAGYAEQIADADSRIPVTSRTPFVFLDGALLSCPGSAHCDRVWSAEQADWVPLERPGSLLDVVCDRLGPSVPAGCGQAGSAAQGPAASQSLDQGCENCAETGRFRWSPAGRRQAVLLPCTAALALAGAAGLALAARRARAEPLEEPLDSGSDLAPDL